MIECQTRYIMGAIRSLIEENLAYLDVRPWEMKSDDMRTQAELAGTVWARTARSWYKNDAGRITNNWSGTTTRYWWMTRRFDREHYRVESAAARQAAQANGAASARSAA